jgi:hypothetical protein
MTAAEEFDPMQEAIALTWKAMTDRLRNLRFGAAASLIGFVALFVAALVYRSVWVAAGLPALILIGSVFVHREQRILFAWEDRVLELWAEANLCMGIFTQTMRNHPHALRHSLQSLVAPLPPNPDFLVPPAGHIAAHRKLFRARSLLQRVRFLRAAARNLALSCLPFTVLWFSREGWPGVLLGLIPLAALPVAMPLLSRCARWNWEKRLAALNGPGRPAFPDFAARVDALDWKRIPPGLRASMQRTLLETSEIAS